MPSLRLIPLAVLALGASSLSARAGAAEAFGAPGLPAMRAPAAKSFLGTAVDGPSRVYFTGYQGIVSEVFYPAVDSPQTVDLQFLVGDRAGTFVDEEKRQPYRARQTHPRTLSWQVETGHAAHRWRIDKRIFVSTERNALIERVTFRALDGARVRDFRLYVLFKPALGNQGDDNNARTVSSARGPVLLAGRGERFSALAASLPWQDQAGRSQTSSGYVGTSDGWTDLLGGARDLRMDWRFDSASRGNVAQMGLLETGPGDATQISFDLVLAFGQSQDAAVDTLLATLAEDSGRQLARYDAGWQRYADSLSPPGARDDDRFLLAAMTLKSAQDKATGAMVAGLGTPWGESQGAGNPGGYHLVWPRDLFKFANALHTAGDRETPRRVVRYLFETLQQKTDCGESEDRAPGCPAGFSRIGRFPQNAWVNGWPYWQGTQMDEQAMPILLAWRLGPETYGPLWPRIRLSADYLYATGPRTRQERWEENAGYSPSTLAAEIAGLVTAADMARRMGDTPRAARYLARADAWQAAIDDWTLTRTGPLGNGRYYLRLNPSGARPDGAPEQGPDVPQSYTVANGGGTRDARAVIDSGFMELVRMGVKRADDPAIRDTVAVFDAVLGQTLPLAEPVALPRNAWFRYNYDGYGEHNDGRDFDGGGRGRLWPILTAERGLLDIALSGRGEAGRPYLKALAQLASPEGFLPEQVWPLPATLPGGWQVDLPAGEKPGTPTRSISPLNWAMGEYISLMASIEAGRIVDMPSVVCQRYHTCQPSARAGEVLLSLLLRAPAGRGERWYVTGDGDALGHWRPGLGLPLAPDGQGRWRQTVALPADRTVRYKYYRLRADGRIAFESRAAPRSGVLPRQGVAQVEDRVD